MIENYLKQLGFSPNLAKTYLALVELGKARAGEIIAKTGLPRSVVYGALAELAARELASQVERRGVAVFSLNDPRYLVEEADRQKELAKEAAKEIKKRQGVLPREIIVAEGLDAMMRATDRSLLAPQGTTMYVLGAGAENLQPALEEHWKKYHRQRIKKQVLFKGLYDRTVEQRHIDWRNQLAGSAARYLPAGLEMPVWFNICQDMVSIMVPGEEPPLVFAIRSNPTAAALKKYFEYLWARSDATR